MEEKKADPDAPAPPPTVKTDVEVAEAPAKDWPHEASDIPADPKAVFGKLPNGMRYLIYPNAEPPGRVSLRLHIAAGSLMEADDQRGLAHFLEHMVFNGSKNFTPEELIPRMQRLGIAFGAHVNAYTSFDETVYMLDLPDLSEEMMKLGFTVMRDFGDGAKLDLAEIDKERGVILSEKTNRDSVGYRLMQQQFEELLPDSLIAKRFPIGDEEVIKSAPRERFVDFYTRYYTPERMTFIVVGDVDPAAIEARIRESFSSMANPAEPGKNPEIGAIKSPEGVETAVYSDKEVDLHRPLAGSVRPYSPVADTRTRRLSMLPLGLAHAAVSRRFERLAKQDGSPVAGGSASRQELFNHAELGSFDVTVTDDRWQEALPVLEQEFRRALEFGFTDAEIAEAKANLLNAYQQAVKTAPSRKSDGIATAVARTINDGSVFSTPETDLEVIAKGLDTATPETCHAAFREFWNDQGMHLILTTKEEPENARGTLLSIYEDSRSQEVTAARADRFDSLRLRGLRPGRHREVAQGGRGPRDEPVRPLERHPAQPEEDRLREGLDPPAGPLRLRQADPAEGQRRPRLLRDQRVRRRRTREALGGRSPADPRRPQCRHQLLGRRRQLLARRPHHPGRPRAAAPADVRPMVDPGYREEALTQFSKAIPMILQQLRHSPAGAQAEMEAWLHGGDSRWGVPDEKKLAAFTLDDARKWLAPALAKDYLELSIVGDFEKAPCFRWSSRPSVPCPPAPTRSPRSPPPARSPSRNRRPK